MRARIWAWVVTSSAVVGSSAIEDVGLERERHGDHGALALAARQLVGIGLQRRARVGQPDLGQQGEGALLRSPRGTRRVWMRNISPIWSPMPAKRVQRRHRLLEDHADRGRRGCRRIAASGMASRSSPSSRRLPPATAMPGGQQAHDGARRASTCPSRSRRPRRGSRPRSSVRETSCSAKSAGRPRAAGGPRGPRSPARRSRPALQPRVQRVVQALPDERDGEHGEQDRDARDGRDVPLRPQHAAAGPDEVAPGGDVGVGQRRGRRGRSPAGWRSP